jgi:hypothetical protein
MKAKLSLFITALVIGLGALFTAYAPALASPVVAQRPLLSRTSKLPSFKRFVAAVRNGQEGVVRGVYIPGVLALPVQQQPVDDVVYVSPDPDAVTQFRLAASYGVTGLLAHNYDAGALFFELKSNQPVRIVYGDGLVKHYAVAGIYRYQALEPRGIQSDFLNLDTGILESVEQVFSQMYTGEDHVTFQTCIAKDGLLTWGRLFVVARPIR